MGAFEYTALDSRSREKRGVLEGDTARQIRQQLREQGLIPLEVDEVAGKEKGRTRTRMMPRPGVSASELALMTRQLATLISAALPLEEALRTVAQQSERPRTKSLLLAVRSRVLEGHTLADGLAEFPHVFPEIYRTTVAAGEQAGHLDMVLERLAEYTEKRQQMRQKILLALFYPAILTTIAILVTIGLLTYVVPEVVKVFENTGQELPGLTSGLISLSDFLRENGIYMLILLIGIATLISYLLKNPVLRGRWHRIQLRLPLVGRLTRGLNSARFARTFSILNASGVPVLEGMRISAEVLGSLPMREGVRSAAQRVREGTPIARALEQSGYFPPMTLHLIASGESSGRLDSMLERAAEDQERELESTVALLMGVFEPLLILTMGFIVLLIVLAILLPIFDMNQLVQL
ncbi:MAG: type II secretion system inner membrane protein GspF [Pseudomonadota bacterium]